MFMSEDKIIMINLLMKQLKRRENSSALILNSIHKEKM